MIFLFFLSASAVYFADRGALRGGTLVQTIREVRPTAFFAVPRVWEKMMEKMVEASSGSKGVKLKLLNWARKVGLERNRRMIEGQVRRCAPIDLQAPILLATKEFIHILIYVILRRSLTGAPRTGTSSRGPWSSAR